MVIITPIVILVCSFTFSSSGDRCSRNTILTTTTILRSNHFSSYGYKRNTSPDVEKLAKEGILLTQLISQTSYMIPLVHLLTFLHCSTKINNSVVFWIRD